MVVLRRPARRRLRRPRRHRLHRARRALASRGLRPRRRQRRLDRDIFPTLERDDHNNPSVIVWRDRLYAFSSPHSGYTFPLDRGAACSTVRRPLGDDGGWGPISTVPMGKGCGLGYTYPNLVEAGVAALPVRARAVLGAVLHLHRGRHARGRRGGRSSQPAGPLTASTRSGRGRTRSTPRARASRCRRRCPTAIPRPTRPASTTCGSRATRSTARRAALGTFDDLPLKFSDLDRVERYSPRHGRAWPMDVAVDHDGDARDRLHRALRRRRHVPLRALRGGRWRSYRISGAGRTLFHYHNSGATFDHARAEPDGAEPQRRRPQRGRGVPHARPRPDVARDRGHALEGGVQHPPGDPARLPRGRPDADPLRSGEAKDYRDFDTTVEMREVPLPPYD